MASNYNINNMVDYLNQYSQQQNIPQYQITPEQMQAYQDMFNIRQQQMQDQQLAQAQLQEAAKKDARIGTVANILGAIGSGAGRRQDNGIDLIFRDYKGNVMGQLTSNKNRPTSTPVAPQNVNTNAAKTQIALQEQAKQQELANAQEMAKFQEAVALANQYNIPIGQAMGLTGKDILGFEKDRATAQAGITKEQIGSTGDLFNTVLKGQQEQQLAEFNAKEKLNQQKQEYLYKGLLAIQEGNIQRGIEEMKQAGLNERQQAELLNRMNIAKVQANAQTNAAATRAAATRYAADQRAQAQPSYGPLSAGLNNLMFLSPEQQARVMADYDAYTRAIGLRGNNIPQVNPQNVNAINNYIQQQGDAYFQ